MSLAISRNKPSEVLNILYLQVTVTRFFELRFLANSKAKRMTRSEPASVIALIAYFPGDNSDNGARACFEKKLSPCRSSISPSRPR